MDIFFWQEGSLGPQRAGQLGEAAHPAFHGDHAQLLRSLWGASLIMVWPLLGTSSTSPCFSLTCWILTQKGSLAFLWRVGFWHPPPEGV